VVKFFSERQRRYSRSPSPRRGSRYDSPQRRRYSPDRKYGRQIQSNLSEKVEISEKRKREQDLQQSSKKQKLSLEGLEKEIPKVQPLVKVEVEFKLKEEVHSPISKRSPSPRLRLSLRRNEEIRSKSPIRKRTPPKKKESSEPSKSNNVSFSTIFKLSDFLVYQKR
jgi:hypothetical protein